MKTVQSACGATAAASTKILVKLQDECECLANTAKEYRDPELIIADPRNEMADILDAIRQKLMTDWAKIISDSVKMTAWQYNQILMMRRLVLTYCWFCP